MNAGAVRGAPSQDAPHLLDLSLRPPEPDLDPGPEYSDEQRSFAMSAGGIDRTPRERLWAAWIAGGDSEKAFLVAARSDDGGGSWSAPRLVIKPATYADAPPLSIINGNLWTDPKGRLWLFFTQSLGYFDGRAGVWFIRCDDPDAAAPAWAPPVRIWHGASLNKPTVLGNGDWLLPVSLWDRKHISPASLSDAHRDLDALRMAHVIASTDQGCTWTLRGGVAVPETNFDEHMVVELRDGRLWMLVRTDRGLSESFSSDGGATWSPPGPSSIRNVSSRFFLRRLASGSILLVKNGPLDLRMPSRSNLTAFRSADDGRTWSEGLLLDERSDVSYPDGCQAPDGTVRVLYDFNRCTDAEILLARFREEDFARPKKVSRGDMRKTIRGTLVSKALATRVSEVRPSWYAVIAADPEWTARAAADAALDRHGIACEGAMPNRMVCDTILREWPDGSLTLFLMTGGRTEPAPQNFIGITRSTDGGRTWTDLEPFDTGLPREGRTIGQCPTELLVLGTRAILFFSTHSGDWRYDWRSWMIESADSGRSWSRPVAVPGRLGEKTFIRNGIVTRDGRIILPFQYYAGSVPGRPRPEPGAQPDELHNPRNGVLVSGDRGASWQERGDIRLTPNDAYFGWAENTIVELSDGRIEMFIRADGLGCKLFRAASTDGGQTWPYLAAPTPIPNPGSKVRLLGLGGDAVALLHNPDRSRRRPLSLWVSFDGMKTWPYQRVLVAESCDGPTGSLNYPDGVASPDGQWIHFAFDDNRHRAVHYRARLPGPAG